MSNSNHKSSRPRKRPSSGGFPGEGSKKERIARLKKLKKAYRKECKDLGISHKPGQLLVYSTERGVLHQSTMEEAIERNHLKQGGHDA